MTFTDDELQRQRCFSDADLKQMKENKQMCECEACDGKKPTRQQIKIDALLARLEAAEDLASYAENPPVAIYERWTKAAGK